MDKEEILKKSREENKGNHDERETMAYKTSAKFGMFVGTIVCVGLILAGEFLFNIPKIAYVGWIVYFSMQGSSNIVLFKNLKNHKDLIWGIIEIILAITFAVLLLIENVVSL